MSQNGSDPFSNPFGSQYPSGAGNQFSSGNQPGGANPYGSGNRFGDAPNPYGAGAPGAGGPTAYGAPVGSGFGANIPQGPTTDVLAVLSLVCAVISPAFYCFCCLSAVPSLAAIVMGHVSLARINRSNGMLLGRGLAIAGLVIGYLVFVATLGMAIVQIVTIGSSVREEQRRREAGMSENTNDRGGDANLRRAEALIDQTGDFAHSNTPTGELMAREMALGMKKFRDEYFTKRRMPPSKDQFVTYCSVGPDSCAFLIYVPEYRKFDDDAKKSLADFAWAMAQQISGDHMAPGEDLAIGMKGQFLFGAVRLGEVAGPNGDLDVFTEGKREDLLRFFDRTPPPEAPETDAVPGPLDTGAKPEQIDPFGAP